MSGKSSFSFFQVQSFYMKLAAPNLQPSVSSLKEDFFLIERYHVLHPCDKCFLPVIQRQPVGCIY